MFTKGTLIKMTDGSHKDISLINNSDYILNKFNQSVKVSKVHVIYNQPVIEILLDNDSQPFYTSINTLFLYRKIEDNLHESGYISILDICNNNNIIKLKNSMKIFSSETDVTIEKCNLNDNLIKDTYCLHTNDSTFTFFANNCIVCCNNC